MASRAPRRWIVTAAIIYMPANLLPVINIIHFGRGGPDTILFAGVKALIGAGMWPVALLVFLASISRAGVLKLIGLTFLLDTANATALEVASYATAA